MDIINEATGSVASFITNRAMPVASIKSEFSASQDLHGYSSPWPAGGGKNLSCFNENTLEQNQGLTITNQDDNNLTLTVGSDNYEWAKYKMPFKPIIGQSYTVSFTGICTSNYKRVYISKNTSATSSGNYYGVLYLTSDEESRSLTFTAETEELYVFCYVCTNGAAGYMTLKNFQVEAGSTATDYAPYSNICPIDGVDTVNEYHRGKNWLKNIIAQGQSANHILLGQTNVNTHETRLKAGTYTVSYKTRSSNIPSIYLKKQGVSTNVKLNNYDTKATFTVDDGTYRFWLYKSNGINYEDIYDAQIELNPSQTNYEPYQSEEQSISLVPALYTLYPDYAPYFQGLLAGTHDFVDLGTFTWSNANITTDNRRWYSSNISNVVKRPESTSDTPYIICTKYNTKQISQYNQAINGITIYTNGSVQIYDADLKTYTTTMFKSAMSGVYAIYKLATPKTPTITEDQFKMLLQAFGATCYGGKVIVNENRSRKLQITHFCEKFDGSDDENWQLINTSNTRYVFRIYFKYDEKPTPTAISEMMSNCIPLAVTSETSGVDNNRITCRGVIYLAKIFYVFTPPDKISTVEELRSFLSKNPEVVTYPLDVPLLIDLPDGETFSSFIGHNNIFCNTGDTTVQYYISVVMDSIESNLIPGGDIKSINVSQNDAGRKVRVSLFDNDVIYNIPSGYIVTGKILTPNHEIVDVEIDDIGDSYVDITIPEEAVSSNGTAMCKLRVKDSEEHPLYDVGFSVFFIEVEAQP